MSIPGRPSTFVTDAQVHIWDEETPERPWVPGGQSLVHRPPLGIDELLPVMDEAGVDRTILVPPRWEGDRNDLALAAVEAHPDRFAIMGRVDLDTGDSTELKSWLDQPGMLGIRLSFIADGALAHADWLWPVAEEAGIPLMVFAPGHTAAIGEISRRCPGLRLLVDHCNISSSAVTADIAPAIDGLIPLAEHPNVAVKFSGLPCALTEGYPFPTLTPFVRRVVDAYGADRCMWGSDYSRLPCPYRDWVNAMAEGLGCLTPGEVDQIMGLAIARWLDWPQPDTKLVGGASTD